MKQSGVFVKAITALNSALCIWFLSTIVAGALSVGWTSFQQCVHDADEMKDNYYKLIHELKERRAKLAVKIQRNQAIQFLETFSSSDEYKNTSYVAVYWKLREVLDSIQFTDDKVRNLIMGYDGDPYWKLFRDIEKTDVIQVSDQQKDFSQRVADDDLQGIALHGPLKRRCGSSEVVLSIASSLFGGKAPQILYVDAQNNNPSPIADQPKPINLTTPKQGP